MKKILLLGGSAQQVIAIETAKRMGLYTVLCDYLPDNPGQHYADVFYQVSTTDKDAVLEVAKKENIDGIVAYSSDPAAPTAAFVADKMNLPGVPVSTAESFCNKNLFRKFLSENGFNVPASVTINEESTQEKIDDLRLPVIIKPTDSSGSKGVTVINELSQFEAARDFASEYSRNGVLIAEEFIVRDHADVIETEIFVLNNEVVVWGIMSTVRDELTNPLIPAAYSYPINISKRRFQLIKKEVDQLVKASKVKDGAFNIEMVITKEDKLFFLDAGPRNGGNMLPEYIGMIKNMDIPGATICAAMGETEKIQGLTLDGQEGGDWGLYVIHSDKKGILKGISYSKLAKDCLLREYLFKPIGSEVKPFENSRDAVGLAFFKFENQSDRDAVLRDFTGKHVSLQLSNE